MTAKAPGLPVQAKSDPRSRRKTSSDAATVRRIEQGRRVARTPDRGRGAESGTKPKQAKGELHDKVAKLDGKA